MSFVNTCWFVPSIVNEFEVTLKLIPWGDGTGDPLSNHSIETKLESTPPAKE